MAYKQKITINSHDSHQISPCYIVAIVPWANLDTYHNKGSNPVATKKPIVIINDITSISISASKSSPQQSANITLMATDVDYSQAVHPGDFLTINMLNYDGGMVKKLYEKASSLQAINKNEFGFKGLFKVQSVRHQVSVSANGVKHTQFSIVAASHTEFNSLVYFNPALETEMAKGEGVTLMSQQLGSWFTNTIKKNINVEIILKSLIQLLLGSGVNQGASKAPQFGSSSYAYPSEVGKLLGLSTKHAKDAYYYKFGVWKNNSSSWTSMFSANGNVYETSQNLLGAKISYPEEYNNKTIWSILQGSCNSTVNEMYSCFSPTKNDNIVPTVVFRQKPFNNLNFDCGCATSKFINMPRWVLDPAMVLASDLGCDEASRINFVQVFGTAMTKGGGAANANQAVQISKHNYFYDNSDIRRSGLRSMITTSNFDLVGNSKDTMAPLFAKLLADMLINGHLKTSGSISCIGITDNIQPGDNIEYNNIIYHVENVSHSLAVNGGYKVFRTNMSVSNGVENNGKYPNQHSTNYDDTLIRDFDGEKILPGKTETQNVFYDNRSQNRGEETNNGKK